MINYNGPRIIKAMVLVYINTAETYYCQKFLTWNYLDNVNFDTEVLTTFNRIIPSWPIFSD